MEWEKVNEVTWRLTDGSMTNVPASHGQWGGYRTPKAIGWVIQVEGKWLARCKDQASYPMLLNDAKAAMAMPRVLDSPQPLTIGIDLGEGQAASFAFCGGLMLRAYMSGSP